MGVCERKKMSKICCIFNYAAHYNYTLYKRMSDEFKCDFYFGDKLKYNLKKFDYDLLPGFRRELNNRYFIGNFNYYNESLSLLDQYDIFFITGEPFCLSSWLLMILAKFKKKKIILWSHGWYGRESFIKKNLKKVYFSLSFHTLLYGDYAKRLMIEEGISSSKMTVIYNSMNYDQQIALREKIAANSVYYNYFANDNPVIIFIGRLTFSKKLEMLLNAQKEMIDENVPFNIIFIGKGEDEIPLKTLSDKLEITANIWFYGACYEEIKLASLIYNADICVSPGEVGLTAIHSMVYGTPVITHNYFPRQGPEFESIKPGVTGAFFEYNNRNSMINTIKDWIKDKAGKREEIRDNCFTVVDRFYNPNNQIEILKHVLR